MLLLGMNSASPEFDIFDANIHIYVNSETGKNSNNGGENTPVKTLNKALNIVKSTPGRPLTVHLDGVFENQRLVVNGDHAGSGKNGRVTFKSDSSAKILGGSELTFVKVTDLPDGSEGRKLAEASGANMQKLWAAAPPEEFPTDINSIRWPDGDCRDFDDYASPPTLSLQAGTVKVDRAREPNLPPTTSAILPEMGEVRDNWLRTSTKTTNGSIKFKSVDINSIDQASDASWNSGAVVVHMFNRVDWYDARVRVGQRSSNAFETITTQKGPGDPNEGNKFIVVKGARYYLEGALEYLDSPGEYYVSGNEVVPNSAGWTLFYPPDGVDMATASATLSLKSSAVIEVDADFVSFEGLHVEGGRRNLAVAVGNSIEFESCSFINAGFDAIDGYGNNQAYRNLIVEGSGASAIQLSDDRDKDSDGAGFFLLDSGNAIVDSRLSDFASTCRHYSEGVHLGGFGSIVSNNHFRSSNMAAIDVVGGGFKIVHNVFSHCSDGSYDDGAIHWVAESPMERGTEVAYNVFFRNGVSKEP